MHGGTGVFLEELWMSRKMEAYGCRKILQDFISQRKAFGFYSKSDGKHCGVFIKQVVGFDLSLKKITQAALWERRGGQKTKKELLSAFR